MRDIRAQNANSFDSAAPPRPLPATLPSTLPAAALRELLPSNPRMGGSLPTETPAPPSVAHRVGIVPILCFDRRAGRGSRQWRTAAGCSPRPAPRAVSPTPAAEHFSIAAAADLQAEARGTR